MHRLRKGKNKSSNIPDLKFKDKKYDTDFDKANLFKDILKDTFQLNEDDSFKDKDFYSKVDTFINDDSYLNDYQNDTNAIPEITMKELKEAIKACKPNTASGIDKIHNQMLKNLPDNFLNQILILFNKSIKDGKVCQIWKTSKITMINKKYSEKTTYKLFDSLLFTVDLDPRDIQKYVNGKCIEKAKLQCVNLDDDLIIPPSLFIFHSLHTLFLFFVCDEPATTAIKSILKSSLTGKKTKQTKKVVIVENEGSHKKEGARKTRKIWRSFSH